MKSFPTAFIKDDLVQPNRIVSTNLTTTAKNLAGAIMNNALGGSEVSKASLGERLTETWLGFDYDTAISETNYAEGRKNYESTNYHLYDSSINQVYHENARKVPALTLASINRYRQIYNLSATQMMDGVKTDLTKAGSSYYFEYYSEAVSPSLFDGKFGVRSQGMTVNTPLMTSSTINYSDEGTGTYSVDSFNALTDDQRTTLMTIYESELVEIEEQLKLIQETKSSYTNTADIEVGVNSEALINANQQNLEARQKELQDQIELLKKSKNETITATSYQLDMINADLDLLENRPNILVDDLEITSYTTNETKEKKETAETPQKDETNKKNSKIFVQLNNDDYDFTDCSIKTLVRLSNGLDSSGSPKSDSTKRRKYRSLGRATYRYADFMFCKDLGKVSNNHLITLRKFNTPIGDNIFKSATRKSDKEIPSSAKLISWFGTDDNKLEDICRYDYNATWRELTAKIEDVESKEDSPKILPSLVNMLNPAYNRGVAKGLWGGNNYFYQKIAAHSGGLLEAKGSYEGDPALYHMDANKVYEPKNTIQSTHTYEGKLTFNHAFTLNFSYKLRSYDGINPKSAFLDLIGNILNVTYKSGTFWGGARRWLGAPRNQAGWNKINQICDKISRGAHAGLEALFGCSSLADLTALVGEAFEALSGMVADAMSYMQSKWEDGTIKEKAKSASHAALDVLGGMLRNKLGRPAIYAMNSLLSGANVGLWHVTIGNPRNPIMAMGNLILDGVTIQHSGPLGIDDFPTDIRVSVKLKHARPRDARAISEMYTCGQGGLILPLNKKRFEKYYNIKSDTNDLLNLEALGVGGYPSDEETKEEAIKAISESWVR